MTIILRRSLNIGACGDAAAAVRSAVTEVYNDQSRMTSLTSWLWGTSQIDDAVGEHSPYHRQRRAHANMNVSQIKQPPSSFQPALRTSHSILKYATRSAQSRPPQRIPCARSSAVSTTRTQMYKSSPLAYVPSPVPRHASLISTPSSQIYVSKMGVTTS